MGVLNGVYLVNGPSSLRVEKGVLEVLGATVGEGERVVIPSGRSIPVYCEDAIVEITPDSSAVTRGDPSVYKSMSETARLLADSKSPVIIGPSDSGKSTLAVWAYNIAASRGDSSILTLDIGQNELYAPGFAALGSAKPPAVPGGSFELRGSCFVGSFTPRGSEAKYLYCAGMLGRRAGGWLVVDTDGWVSLWDGILLKVALASVLASNLIVLIGVDERIARLFRDVTGADVVVIDRPPVKTKDRGERRIHRERLIAKQLVEAKSRPVRLRETSVYWSPLFKGDPLTREELQEIAGRARLVYGERGTEGITVVARGGVRIQGVHVVRDGWERGLIASLTYKGSGHLAVIERINYNSMTMNVLTRYQGPVDYVEVGSARVDIDSFKS